MGEEEKKLDERKIRLVITLPTKENVVEALSSLFPGIKVEDENTEKPGESVAEESPTE